MGINLLISIIDIGSYIHFVTMDTKGIFKATDKVEHAGFSDESA